MDNKKIYKTLCELKDSHYDYMTTSGIEGKSFAVPKILRHKLKGLLWHNEFLPYADLTGCTLSGGNFIDCEFSSADFQTSYIRDVYCINTDFRGANLSRVDASNSLFHKCDFSYAMPSISRFVKCYFTKSKFNNARFFNSNFFGSVFADVYFIGVDFSDCDVSQVRFFDCQYDQKTFWPKGFERGAGLSFCESMKE
jgi:uncharacterized protein YjbI with pentapeptide repeats